MLSQIKVLQSTRFQHCWGERAKRFSLLDRGIDLISSVWQSRISEDRSAAESSRAKLDSASKPTDGLTLSEAPCYLYDELIMIGIPLDLVAPRMKPTMHDLGTLGWTEEHVPKKLQPWVLARGTSVCQRGSS